MKFPDDWPENCPPNDATEASGTVYRLVHNDPPLDVDFLTHEEIGKLPKADPCLRRGLSVFREEADVVHQRQLIPQLGKWIAEAQLTKDHGKTKLTSGRQPTHTTWWVYEGVVREAGFAVVKEQG